MGSKEENNDPPFPDLPAITNLFEFATHMDTIDNTWSTICDRVDDITNKPFRLIRVII